MRAFRPSRLAVVLANADGRMTETRLGTVDVEARLRYLEPGDSGGRVACGEIASGD